MNINPLYNVRETAVFSAGLAENRGRFKTLGKTSIEAESKKGHRGLQKIDCKDESGKESAILQQLHQFLHMVKTDTINATISLTA